MTARTTLPQSYLALIHGFGAVFDAEANAWDVMPDGGEVCFSLPGTMSQEALHHAVHCYVLGQVAGRAEGAAGLQRTIRDALGIPEHP